MKKPGKTDLIIFSIMATAWILILLLPVLIAWLTTGNWEYTKNTGLMTLNMFQSPMLLFFINFYVFDRWLFVPRRYAWFAVANLLLMTGLNWTLFFIYNYAPEMPDMAWAGMYIGLFVYFLLNCSMIAAAIGIRHFMRVHRLREQLKEEQAHHTEAELAWLKNQINPHFLFNTLNNISSLAAIDGEATQEAIAQLSDLLRYAIYETNKKSVPLKDEVEFMRNYISLMKLRVGGNTIVRTELEVVDARIEIAPLLFISIVENAFKHGVSSNKPSFITISLKQHENLLHFECRNSNYPKTPSDRSGNGIGIENTLRRLELLYPGQYSWEKGLCDNGTTYFSDIRISIPDYQS
ncbi:MAG: histidine kinase [Prevotella sp.]|nr:histidine kinase [Prevotella sp.]